MKMLTVLASVLALAGFASAAQGREVVTKVYPSPEQAATGIRESISGSVEAIPGRFAPAVPFAQASRARLGEVEARVQLWRAVQRYWARNMSSTIYEFSESFSCYRVSRFRMRCWFSFMTSSGYRSGEGFVKEYYPAWRSPYVGKYYWWWRLF